MAEVAVLRPEGLILLPPSISPPKSLCLHVLLDFTCTKPQHCPTHSSMHRVEHSMVAQKCFVKLFWMEDCFSATLEWKSWYCTQHLYISTKMPLFCIWVFLMPSLIIALLTQTSAFNGCAVVLRDNGLGKGSYFSHPEWYLGHCLYLHWKANALELDYTRHKPDVTVSRAVMRLGIREIQMWIDGVAESGRSIMPFSWSNVTLATSLSTGLCRCFTLMHEWQNVGRYLQYITSFIGMNLDEFHMKIYLWLHFFIFTLVFWLVCVLLCAGCFNSSLRLLVF